MIEKRKNTFSLMQKIRNKIRVDSSTNLSIARKVKIVNCSINIKGKNNKLVIKDGAVLRNVTVEIIGKDCLIEIGENCMIGDNCYLSAKETGIHLVIKADCGLSRNVKVMTSDGHPIFQNGMRINPAKDICINRHCWIADNVTILKGVTIGEGSVVGINSTVVKDIPIKSVAVGNPAKVVKEGIEWEADL